jgi:hypothetical protein
MPEIRDRSAVFRVFLEFTPDAVMAFDEEMALGELLEHQYIYYEREGNGQLLEEKHIDLTVRSDSQLILDDNDNNEDGYMEDDEFDEHESHLGHSDRRLRKRDSMLETSLNLQFDDEGNPIAPER